MLLVQTHQIRALGGAQIHHRGGGSAGDHERRVDLAVLQRLGGIAEGEVLRIDVGLGHVIGRQEVHGVEVNAGARRADGHILALQILHGLNGRVAGDQLHGLVVQRRQRGKAGDGIALVLLEADAVVGVIGHVALHKAQLCKAHVQHVDVGRGALARHGRDRDVGMVGDVLGQHAAEGVVGARGSAGGKGQLRKRRGAGERQHQSQKQSHEFLHFHFLHPESSDRPSVSFEFYYTRSCIHVQYVSHLFLLIIAFILNFASLARLFAVFQRI